MKKIVAGLVPFIITLSSFAKGESVSPSRIKVINNKALVSFDVSAPIDSTGYVLEGKNLKGGVVKFQTTLLPITSLLSYERGGFQTPLVKSNTNNALIKTHIKYQAIKLKNPNGINPLFIKIGSAIRKQTVSGLDPSVLKPGSYEWQAPIFSFGSENTAYNGKVRSNEFILVGSQHGGPASKNVMYTQSFYLYNQAEQEQLSSETLITSDREHEVLPIPQQEHFSCKAEGLWGDGGADPHRSLSGHCKGSSKIYPGGPNLDYEYGDFELPTVHTPWTATPNETCKLPGEKTDHLGCVNAQMKLRLRYMAQKIRVPIRSDLSIFAEFGTAYRTMRPKNLRYICQDNIYLKKILNPIDCQKKSYLPGGGSYPFFAVGYEFIDPEGKKYSARYINIPGQENGNRLAWIDASNTEIYAVSVPPSVRKGEARTQLRAALNLIKATPQLNQVLGKHFFEAVLKKNGL